jgi:hypothetical protein
LKVLPPLYVHKKDGTYTKEVVDMFKEWLFKIWINKGFYIWYLRLLVI